MRIFTLDNDQQCVVGVSCVLLSKSPVSRLQEKVTKIYVLKISAQMTLTLQDYSGVKWVYRKIIGREDDQLSVF